MDVMLFRFSAILLTLVTFANTAHAQEAFKYKSGTVVYSSHALICTDPRSYDEFMALAKIGTEEDLERFDRCGFIHGKTKAAVIQNIGYYVNIIIAIPGGKAQSVWTKNGFFKSEEDQAWVDCEEKTPSNSKCIDLADRENLED